MASHRIQELTAVASPRLCPEIRLHLITPEQPLWRAGQAELDAQGLDDPFWAFCWPGGQALARFVLDQPTVVRAKRVLSFGAGGGVEAIAAAMSGADVTASDTDPLAVLALHLNARLNHVALRTTHLDLVGVGPGPWDVVLVGDVTYERELAEKVRAWSIALARQGVDVFIADPNRGFLDASGWKQEACYEASADDDQDGTRRVPTPVFRVG
jgi:predicted nicotinamide N-methyase